MKVFKRMPVAKCIALRGKYKEPEAKQIQLLFNHDECGSTVQLAVPFYILCV